MNPVLRLRNAFRSMVSEGSGAGVEVDAEMDAILDEATDAVSEYGYSRRESDLRFERMMAEMRQQTAEMRQQTAEMRQTMSEFRNQVMVAILVATGLIIGAWAAGVAVLASLD